MGDEDNKKKERGVAEVVPVRTDGTRPIEKNLVPLDLPFPKRSSSPGQESGGERERNLELQGKKKAPIV